MNKIKIAIDKRKQLKNGLTAIGIFAMLWIGTFVMLMLRDGLVPIGTPMPTISEWTIDAVKWATISTVIPSALALPVIGGYVWFTERRKK